MTLLLVEDDHDLLGMMYEIVAQYRPDLTVEKAWSGRQLETLALEAAPPHNLVLTGNMATRGISGIEVAKNLRARGYRSPIVVISGDLPFHLYQQAAMQAGVTEIHQKPFQINLLKNIVDKYCPRKC